MSQPAYQVFGLAAVTLVTSGFLWVIAAKTAVLRGLELGSAPYLWLLLGAASGALLSCGSAVAAIASCGICVGAVCDARTGYIFDPVVYGALGVAGALAFWTGAVGDSLAGAATIAGTLLGLRLLTGRRGLGLGDIKLGALIGAGLGPALGIVAVGAAFVLGAASSVGQIVAGRAALSGSVRFGPYLAAGSLVVLAYHRVSTGVIP